jgi:hypothetical protein
MSQRASGYARRPDEDYATIAWPILALLAARRTAPVGRIWDPCCGVGKLVAVLRIRGFDAIGTDTNFLATTIVPAGVSDLITNPPYGENKRGELAVKFIEHALALGVPNITMLLRVDFDSAKSRQHLFRNNPYFAGKVVLLDRIKWFEGSSSPSDNHAWFTWSCGHVGLPTITYITRAEGARSLTLAKPASVEIPATVGGEL